MSVGIAAITVSLTLVLALLVSEFVCRKLVKQRNRRPPTRQTKGKSENR